ncbi:hypothetical protein DUI87_02055 [Hirundo rustica rustica]|uniref:ribonuclease H n=1 Tax=Hirundo rustica rustica TaxID=333673 RepID=A0A3M0LQ60_HIRRU|nr:hypothetical protein DUI87_02055 [Hirundo rustica rustica]
MAPTAGPSPSGDEADPRHGFRLCRTAEEILGRPATPGYSGSYHAPGGEVVNPEHPLGPLLAANTNNPRFRLVPGGVSPVVYKGSRGGHNVRAVHHPFSQATIRDLCKAHRDYGWDSPYFRGLLLSDLEAAVVIPADLRQLFSCLLDSTEFKLWEAAWRQLLREALPSLLTDPESAIDENGNALTLEQLMGEGRWTDLTDQASGIPIKALQTIREHAVTAFFSMVPDGPIIPYYKIVQGTKEAFTKFVERLTRAIEVQVAEVAGMKNSPVICQWYVASLSPVRAAAGQAIIHHYMDDVLVCAPTDDVLTHALDLTIDALIAAGFELQEEKVQRMLPWKYLGLEIGKRTIVPQKLAIKTKWKDIPKKDRDGKDPLSIIEWVFLSHQRSKRMTRPQELVAELIRKARFRIRELAGWEKAGDAIKHLIHAFSFLGILKELKTDNGPAYKSRELCSFLQQWGVEHKTGIPHSPTAHALSGVRKQFPDAHVYDYMDDILVAKPTQDELLRIQPQLLNALHSHGLQVAPEKVQQQPPWKYLGVKILERTIRHQEVQFVQSVKTLNDAQKLVGVITWLRPYLGLTTAQLSPLFELLKEDTDLKSPRELTPEARKVLEEVQQAVSARQVYHIEPSIDVTVFITTPDLHPTGIIGQWNDDWTDPLHILEWVFLPHQPHKTVTALFELIARLIIKCRQRCLQLMGADPSKIILPVQREEFDWSYANNVSLQSALEGFSGQITYHLPSHKLLQVAKNTQFSL